MILSREDLLREDHVVQSSREIRRDGDYKLQVEGHSHSYKFLCHCRVFWTRSSSIKLTWRIGEIKLLKRNSVFSQRCQCTYSLQRYAV